MATYSSNTTIKRTGTQVVATATSTGSLYTVTSGKTFVGAISIMSDGNPCTISVDGTVVLKSSASTTSQVLQLFANSGAVISCIISGASSRCSIVGILEENTP